MGADLDDAIRSILIRDWDPLDIASERPVEDEYDPYLHQLHDMASRRLGADALFVALWRIETVLLRQPGDWPKTRGVAEKIAALDPGQ
ncbi:MAG TPA: hypothetical protein VIM58_02090 [Candidatus Methylacidiphilales bacterium]